MAVSLPHASGRARRMIRSSSTDTAKEIYEHCNRQLGEADFTAQGLLAQYDVKVVCSTDDPSTIWSRTAATRRTPRRAPSSVRPGVPTRRWRCTISRGWNEWIDELAAVAASTFASFASAARGAAEAPRLLPRDGLPRVRSRPGAHLRGAVHGARGRGDFAKARAGKPLSPDEIEKLRSALTVRLRGDGSRARLGAAVPPGRHAQQQHARDARARARHRLRRDRRLPAGRGAGALPRSPGFGGTPGEDDRLQPEPARQRAADDDHRLVPGRLGARARCSSAAPGGSWISSTAWRSR